MWGKMAQHWGFVYFHFGGQYDCLHIHIMISIHIYIYQSLWARSTISYYISIIIVYIIYPSYICIRKSYTNLHDLHFPPFSPNLSPWNLKLHPIIFAFFYTQKHGISSTRRQNTKAPNFWKAVVYQLGPKDFNCSAVCGNFKPLKWPAGDFPWNLQSNHCSLVFQGFHKGEFGMPYPKNLKFLIYLLWNPIKSWNIPI